MIPGSKGNRIQHFNWLNSRVVSVLTKNWVLFDF